MSQRMQFFVGLAAVMTVAMVFKASMIDASWFLQDDDRLVIAQVDGTVHTHPILTPDMGHPMPLTLAVYRTVFRYVGLAPAPYHAVNVGFGIAGALAIFGLAYLVFGRRVWPAGITALLFTLHPVSADPTAWITSLKDVGPLPWLALAAALIVERRGRLTTRQHWLVFGLFVVAMGFKPTAAAFVPFAAYLILAYGGGTWQALRGVPRRQILLFAIMLAMGVGAMMVSRQSQRTNFETLVDVSLSEQMTLVGHVFSSQLNNVLQFFGGQRVYNLSWAYTELSVGDVVVNSLLLVTALAGAFVYLVDIRNRRLRPFTPGRFGLMWAMCFYAPNSGVFGAVQLVVDQRYMYLALPGIMMCIVAAGDWCYARLTSRTLVRPVGIVALLFGVFVMGLAHQDRASLWEDGGHTYYAHAMVENPPVVGNLLTQEICTAYVKSHAFRYDGRGRSGVGVRTLEQLERALVASEQCDPEVPEVRRVIDHAHRRLLELRAEEQQLQASNPPPLAQRE